MASTKLFILTCLVLMSLASAQEDAQAMWDACKKKAPLGTSLTADQKCAAIKDNWSVCAISSVTDIKKLMTMAPKLQTIIADELKTEKLTACTITVDKDMITKAAVDKCGKANVASPSANDTAKCENLKKIMGCVLTRLPPGDGITLKTKLQTEADKLATGVTGCTAPKIDSEYVTGQVFDECKVAPTKANPTDTEKCDALKARVKCSVGKMFKSFTSVSASGALGDLAKKAKDEAGNVKDCQEATNILEMARQQFMGGDASQAQVSFAAIALTLTAVVMMR